MCHCIIFIVFVHVCCVIFNKVSVSVSVSVYAYVRECYVEEGGDTAMFQATAARHCRLHELSQYSGHSHGSQSSVEVNEHFPDRVGNF